MRMSQKLVQCFSLVLIGLVAGCGGEGDELPRQAVSGTVTLDDAPLANGFIQFQPAGAEGVAAGGTVTDGKYAIDRAQGPVAGDYKVLISSTPATEEATSAEPPPPGAPTAPPTDPIPAKYNSKTTLTAKVEAGKPNTFDFPMKSK